MPPNVRSNFIDTKFIAAAKGRFRWSLMDHPQGRPLRKIKTSEKGLPTFMIGESSGASISAFTVPNGHDPKSHLHPLKTVEFVLKLEFIDKK